MLEGRGRGALEKMKVVMIGGGGARGLHFSKREEERKSKEGTGMSSRKSGVKWMVNSPKRKGDGVLGFFSLVPRFWVGFLRVFEGLGRVTIEE